MLTGIKVGQRYPQYVSNMSGMFCDYDEGGFYFLALINGPTRKEIRAMNGDLRFGCAKIGQMDWFTFFYNGIDFDSHFAPGLFKFAKPDLKLFPEWQDGGYILTTIMSFDSRTGECLSIRAISLDPEISGMIVRTCQEAAPILPEEYHYQINRIYDTYTTADLRKIAVKQGLTQNFFR